MTNDVALVESILLSYGIKSTFNLKVEEQKKLFLLFQHRF